MSENIAEFDEFLSIHQHFPYQNFSLMISSAICMPDHFFVQGVIASYSIRAHAILFPVHASGKTVVYSYADYCAHSKQQSCTAYS